MHPINQIAENRVKILKSSRIRKFERNYFARQPCYVITFLLFFLPPYFALISQSIQISDGVSITKSSRSGITQILLITSLEKIGLVKQIEDPHDKRLRLVGLSEHGEKLAVELDEIATDATKTFDYLENELGLYLSQKLQDAELALREKISKSMQKFKN